MQRIERILNEHAIPYEREKRFGSCKRKNTLPFDFYIKKLNVLIEYNGEQHYRASDYFGGTKKLKEVKERDEIKERWARENGFKLITIRYNEEDIENKLTEALLPLLRRENK